MLRASHADMKTVISSSCTSWSSFVTYKAAELLCTQLFLETDSLYFELVSSAFDNMRNRNVDEGPSGCCTATTSWKLSHNHIPRKMRVLAVDDSNVDRKLIEVLLKSSSFKVTTVNSARRALEVLGIATKGSTIKRGNATEFDLIITDYCMPEMTGYELLKRVKQETSVWKHVPVIIMSSENVPFRINRCMEEGAEDFLIKPVQLADINRLKGHVRQLVCPKKSSCGDRSRACSKRKATTSTQGQVQSLERRPRLNELTVA